MTPRAIRRICVVGGAGFIGGHFVNRLLASDATERLTVYDNFSSGREWHLAAHRADTRLNVIKRDVRDLEALVAAVDGHDTMIHLASNPDISRAMTEPAVDFDQGRCSPIMSPKPPAAATSAWSSTPPAAACTATSARPRRPRITGPWFPCDLRGEQARRRSPPGVLRGHVRRHRAGVPVR